jgi:hypothetical protein
MIDLSVVIINWNTRDLLRECLASLQNHVSAVTLEIFVVDNGSHDGSVAMARKEFPEAIVVENLRNLGFARANNIALQRAQGRFWLLLNSDTVVEAGALEGLLTTMEHDPAIGIAGLQLLNEGGSLQNSISNTPSLLTEFGNKSLLRWFFPQSFPDKEQRYTKPVEVDSVIGARLMVRREAAEQVRLLDEEYFFFLEETDWCLRLKQAGWKVIHDPRYSIYHLQGKSAGKFNVRARIEYLRSRYTFFQKHRRPAVCMALRIGLLFRLIVSFSVSVFTNLLTAFTRQTLRIKLATYGGILKWHLRGCPEHGGLMC